MQKALVISTGDSKVKLIQAFEASLLKIKDPKIQSKWRHILETSQF